MVDVAAAEIEHVRSKMGPVRRSAYHSALSSASMKTPSTNSSDWLSIRYGLDDDRRTRSSEARQSYLQCLIRQITGLCGRSRADLEHPSWMTTGNLVPKEIHISCSPQQACYTVSFNTRKQMQQETSICQLPCAAAIVCHLHACGCSARLRPNGARLSEARHHMHKHEAAPSRTS